MYISMGLDNILNSRGDYTLEDLKREPFDRRLEILATTVNLIPRTLLYLSLEYRKVYTTGSELLEDLLRYLNIPIEEFRKNEEFYKSYILGPLSYWHYVSVDKIGNGIMTRINLTTKVWFNSEKVGYTLTSFGRDLKPFVAYILKKLAEYEINSWKLFGSTPNGREKKVFYNYN